MARAIALLVLIVAVFAAATLLRREPSSQVPVIGTAQAGVEPADAARGWPNLFGPGHNSESTERVATNWPSAGPPELWRKECGRGYSAPVVQVGRLILFHRLGNEEIIECKSAESGESLWKHAYPTAYKCPVEYSDGPYSTPVIEEDRVYAWGAEGTLRCVELAGGKLLWQRNLTADFEAQPAGFFPVASSPLLEGDRLILNVGGARHAGVVALDKLTGDTLWTATDDTAGYATPLAATLHERRYVFVFTGDGLVALDPADGRVWWSIPFRAKNSEIVNATSPIVWDDLVFVSGYSLGSLCVRVLPSGECQEVWRDKRRNLDSQYNNLFRRDGYVYGFASLDRTLRCLELRTGEVKWKWESEIGRGASLAVGDRLILFGERGHLGAIEIDPASAKPVCLTEQSLVGNVQCFSAPALCDGRLYLRTETTVVCLDVRE